ENAWPRLRARGWPFTVFVSTDAVDRHLPDFMSWKEMRQMAAGGATFANHSSTHDYLVHRKADESDAAWRSRVKFDIEHAGKRLQTELGGAVTANPRLFAYPYGEYDEALAGLVREMGFVAFGQESGAIGPESDPRLMPRFPMAEHFAGMSQFITKAQSLPLVVSKQQPWDPTDARRHNPPELMLTVTSPGADLDRLACYYKGRRMQIDWLDRAAGRFRIRATSPVPPPRDRYNCTAPNAQQRYYWFSHLWIPVPAVPDSRPSDTKD
ncbi:MAG: polysaccharide deacetylase family protein, partial [Gammaproteobacteria bacterium]